MTVPDETAPAGDDAQVTNQEVRSAVKEVRTVAQETADALRVSGEETAAELARTVVDTAEGVRLTAEQTAADLATLVKETATLLKDTTEETARIVREAAQVQAQFSPLLVKSLDVIAVTVAELNQNSVLLRDQATSEAKMLQDRTKYFVWLIGIGVLIAVVTFVNLFLNITAII